MKHQPFHISKGLFFEYVPACALHSYTVEGCVRVCVGVRGCGWVGVWLRCGSANYTSVLPGAFMSNATVKSGPSSFTA